MIVGIIDNNLRQENMTLSGVAQQLDNWVKLEIKKNLFASTTTCCFRDQMWIYIIAMHQLVVTNKL